MKRTWVLVAVCLLASMAALDTGIATDNAMLAPTSAPPPLPICPVTQPNGDMPLGAGNPRYVGGHGNDALWTNLWMWGEGSVPVVADPDRPGQTHGPGKWAWYRYATGKLTIEGRRLDAPAPPLRAHLPAGYGDHGFQVSGLDFPTPGCWEVTGRVGDAGLTFVVYVELSTRQP